VPSYKSPARLSTLAGTPTSRSAAAEIRVRFAHDAATFTNASSSSGSRAAWSICASCASMSRRCWIQFDLTDRRRLVGDPLFDLVAPLLEGGPAVCRHLRCPQRRQIGSDRGGLGSTNATLGWALGLTPRHLSPPQSAAACRPCDGSTRGAPRTDDLPKNRLASRRYPDQWQTDLLGVCWVVGPRGRPRSQGQRCT
jgi:hypothetical protein